jgi:hypothetical protein
VDRHHASVHSIHPLNPFRYRSRRPLMHIRVIRTTVALAASMT